MRFFRAVNLTTLNSSDPKHSSLRWYAIQTLFEETDADVLLLLDCCAAASSAPAEDDCLSVTETIAACGFETWAPQPGRFSFTNTLIAVLDDWQTRPSFTAAMLHCEVLNRLRHEKPEPYRKTKKFEHRKTPIHVFSTNDLNARSVEICPLNLASPILDDDGYPTPAQTRGASTSKLPTAPILEEGGSSTDRQDVMDIDSIQFQQSDPYNSLSLTRTNANGATVLPQVLITVALEEQPDTELDLEQWRRWLQQFPSLAVYATVQGVYSSNSTLLILSVPVLVWDWIPEDPACAFIAYVYSGNRITHAASPIADIQSSANVAEQKKTSSQRKKKTPKVAAGGEPIPRPSQTSVTLFDTSLPGADNYTSAYQIIIFMNLH